MRRWDTEYAGPQHRLIQFKPGRGVAIKAHHAAAVKGTTIYPTTIAAVEDTLRILKSGHNQRKIGKTITKGAWRGFEIYCLTLTERMTCPRQCEHWLDCYGNGMHRAQRLLHDKLFEDVLVDELAELQAKHPSGFAIRLHVLGDFYSLDYVELWARALDRFAALHIFGFTRRWAADGCAIGARLLELSTTRWDRFAMRFSGVDAPRGSTTFSAGQVPQGIPCPAQRDQTDCCATCGLCWATTRTIAFENHSSR